jgi:hypothetical protein
MSKQVKEMPVVDNINYIFSSNLLSVFVSLKKHATILNKQLPFHNICSIPNSLPLLVISFQVVDRLA